MIVRIFRFLCLIFVVIAEMGMSSFLPNAIVFRPALVLLVFYSAYVSSRDVLLMAVVAGILMDAYAITIPDIATLRFPLLILLAIVVQHYWLTNRSLIAAIGLMVFIRFADFFSVWIVRIVYGLIDTSSQYAFFSWRLGSEVLWDVLGISVLFFLFQFRRRSARFVHSK